MDKRDITKKFAKLVVGTSVGSYVTRQFLAKAPKTEKFKVAELSGAMAGYVAAEQLEPLTDALVDDLFDRLEARKHLHV